MMYCPLRANRPLIFGLLLLLGSPSDAIAADDSSQIDASDRASTLVVGAVSHNFKKHYRDIKPMGDYLVEHMGDTGISACRVVLASDNEELIEHLQKGHIDLITETPFSASLFLDSAEFEVLVRRWKGGVREYHSIIFVRKDSPIHVLSDLVGHTIAFEDRGSSSGYYLPAAELLDHGLMLAKLPSLRAPVPEGRIGYVFSREEINAVTWVFKGLADAGVLSNLDWNKESRVPVRFREELRILHETQSIPRSVVLVRSSLSDELKSRLRDVFLQAHEDPAANRILLDFQRTTRFEARDQSLIDSLAEAARVRMVVQGALE